MSVSGSDDVRTSLIGEALLCGLLGKILYQDPEQSWLEALIRDDVFEESPFGAEQTEMQRGLELLQRWTAENHNGLSATEMKALLSDQLHLFIGIDHVLAPVWESVYFSEQRLVFQEQTLQVREWYARFNLQLEKLNREPDDHIGLELAFVAHLATRAVQAIDDGQQQSAQELLQAEGEFLMAHLLRWGPAWAKLVKKHAQTDFYRGLGYVVHGTMLALAEAHKLSMPKEVSL
jgi:putative dimethyl sulfoxide reductase chaperone